MGIFNVTLYKTIINKYKKFFFFLPLAKAYTYTFLLLFVIFNYLKEREIFERKKKKKIKKKSMKKVDPHTHAAVASYAFKVSLTPYPTSRRIRSK